MSEIVCKDTSSTIRGIAAAVLAEIGPPAYGKIQQLLLGPDLRVRQTMATAIRTLHPIPAALQSYVD